MNFKTTYVLFGVLLVVLGGFLLSQLLVKPPREESEYLLPTLHDAKIEANDITTVEIKSLATKYPAEKLVFVRWDRGWQAQMGNVRADRAAVDQIVTDVMNAAQTPEEKGADVTGDLKKFGLEPPAVLVTLRKGSDREWRLNVGDTSPGKEDAVLYLSSSDRPKEVIAMRRSKLGSLFTKDTSAEPGKKPAAGQADYRLKTLVDLRSRELLAEGIINLSDLATQVALRAAKDPAVLLEKRDQGRWRFLEPKLGPADFEGDAALAGPGKPPAGVRDLLRDLGDLKVSSTESSGKPGADELGGRPEFVKDNVEDMGLYGLRDDRPATLKIELRRAADGQSDQKESVQEVLLIGNKIGERYYARLGSEASVVKVSAAKLEPVLLAARDPGSLRSHELVDLEVPKIDAIDIKNANGLTRLRRPLPGTWRLASDGGQERNADLQSAQDLLNALTARRLVQSFPKPAPDPEFGFDHPAATVSLWADGLDNGNTGNQTTKPAPVPGLKLKDEQHPAIRLFFGKKEGQSVYVRSASGSDQSVVTVPVSLLDRLIQAPVAYLDRTLPLFPESAEVTRLVVDRNGESFELHRGVKDTKGADVWKFQKPADLAGRPADAQNVDRMIRELRGLTAEKLIAEDPAAPQLHGFGLEPPQAKVILTVRTGDKQTADHMYLFGRETDDKTGAYAKQGERRIVFVVRPQVVEILRAELQDSTVFQFEPDKVRDLKMTGWRKAVGFDVTLQVQRQGAGGWTVKQPGGFELDQTRAESLIRTLSSLRPERFVVRRSGPRPEFKLDAKDRSLQIEIMLEGEKAPLTLTIGDFDAKAKGSYAESSTRKGDVFLLPEEPFGKFLAGVRHFSRSAEAK